MIKYNDVIKNEDINIYITQADLSLKAMGYTEHSFAHVTKCAKDTELILTKLGYSKEEINLGMIAAYMHDIGNVVNRADHAQTGALMAFRLLDKMGMSTKNIALVITAIGNHDEVTANTINPITAALIIADKADVRRSRVRNPHNINFEIHDRVNFAVEFSKLSFSDDLKYLYLTLKIDTNICSVLNYFEIFLDRMMLCKKACEYLGCEFKLVINDLTVL